MSTHFPLLPIQIYPRKEQALGVDKLSIGDYSMESDGAPEQQSWLGKCNARKWTWHGLQPSGGKEWAWDRWKCGGVGQKESIEEWSQKIVQGSRGWTSKMAQQTKAPVSWSWKMIPGRVTKPAKLIMNIRLKNAKMEIKGVKKYKRWEQVADCKGTMVGVAAVGYEENHIGWWKPCPVRSLQTWKTWKMMTATQKWAQGSCGTMMKYPSGQGRLKLRIILRKWTNRV